MSVNPIGMTYYAELELILSTDFMSWDQIYLLTLKFSSKLLQLSQKNFTIYFMCYISFILFYFLTLWNIIFHQKYMLRELV